LGGEEEWEEVDVDIVEQAETGIGKQRRYDDAGKNGARRKGTGIENRAVYQGGGGNVAGAMQQFFGENHESRCRPLQWPVCTENPTGVREG